MRSVENAVSGAGGEMFELNEHERIIEKIIMDSKRREQASESASHFFLLLAGIIFLVDVSWRRLTENRRGA